MDIRESLIGLFLEAVSRPRVSRIVGHASDVQLPQPILRSIIRAYAGAFGIDLSEAVEPTEGYRNFDEFFTRRLRPGVRSVVPGARRLVSPVDGRLLNHGVVENGRLLQVKGMTYSVDELLDDAEAARRFYGGNYFTLYLSPRDYHRVHAPLDGEIVGYRYTPGRLYPVNKLGCENVPGLFRRNERLTTFLRTALGHMALVMVGATSVGRISVTYADVRTNGPDGTAHSLYYAHPKAIGKGAEIGTFHLGSTVVLLVEPPVLALEKTLQAGNPVTMGEPLARR